MDINVYKVEYKGFKYIMVVEERSFYDINIDTLYPLMTYVNVVDEECNSANTFIAGTNYTSIIRSNGTHSIKECLGVDENKRFNVEIKPITTKNFNTFVKTGIKVMLAELRYDTYYKFDHRRGIANALRYILNVK